MAVEDSAAAVRFSGIDGTELGDVRAGRVPTTTNSKLDAFCFAMSLPMSRARTFTVPVYSTFQRRVRHQENATSSPALSKQYVMNPAIRGPVLHRGTLQGPGRGLFGGWGRGRPGWVPSVDVVVGTAGDVRQLEPKSVVPRVRVPGPRRESVAAVMGCSFR